MPRYLTIILFFVILFNLPAYRSFASTLNLTIGDERINLYSESSSLFSIAELISQKTGVRVYLDRSQEGRLIDVDIRDALLEKGVKMLAYPLNFVIVKDAEGRIQELRIFKNHGLDEKSYRVFKGSKYDSVKPSAPDILPVSGDVSRRLEAPATGIPAKDKGPETGALNEEEYLLIHDSEPVTGEEAFMNGIWTVKRMMESGNMAEQMQVKAEQRDVTKKTFAAINEINQFSTPSKPDATLNYNIPGQQRNAGPCGGAGGSAICYSAERYNSRYTLPQQRGFNNLVFYQQMNFLKSQRMMNVRGH